LHPVAVGHVPGLRSARTSAQVELGLAHTRTYARVESNGRPQAEEAPASRLPATVGAVAQMNWDDLQIFGATLFADEIASVMRGEGDAAVRERGASLPVHQRAVLREALGEPEPV
jgi:hypothetical protein